MSAQQRRSVPSIKAFTPTHMNMGHMRCLGPLEAPIEWKSDELCGRNQTRQCRGWFPDGRRVRSMAFAKGSGTDLCTSDSVIRQMMMMMEKSGRRPPPLAPHRPRTGSNPPSERSRPAWKGTVHGLCERLWDRSVHCRPRHTTDDDDDGQIWAPTPATGSSQAQNWLQPSK